jgi:prevent-host-death family protein
MGELMTEVNIAELKAHLSEHLRRVRRGGSVLVLDRQTPVARIVPVDEPATEGLPGLSPSQPLRGFRVPSKPLVGDEDIAAALQAERVEPRP